MKTTRLTKIEVPHQLVKHANRKISKGSQNSIVNLETRNLLKWNSVNYTGAAFSGSMFALNIVTGIEALFLPLAVLSSTALAVSILVHSTLFLLIGKNHFADSMNRVRYKGRAIAGKSDSYSGILRIKQRTKRFASLYAFLPVRIFRKQLLSETTYYEPLSDVYTKESIYLTAQDICSIQVSHDGLRRQFRKSLETI